MTGTSTTTGRARSVLTHLWGRVLTSRDLRAATGGETRSIALKDIDPAAPERMARTARRAVKSKGLADIQYVLLNSGFLPNDRPGLSLYLPPGSDPPYVAADLHGRHLTWPGRT
jgi:hypothetical protein